MRLTFVKDSSFGFDIRAGLLAWATSQAGKTASTPLLMSLGQPASPTHGGVRLHRPLLGLDALRGYAYEPEKLTCRKSRLLRNAVDRPPVVSRTYKRNVYSMGKLVAPQESLVERISLHRPEQQQEAKACMCPLPTAHSCERLDRGFQRRAYTLARDLVPSRFGALLTEDEGSTE